MCFNGTYLIWFMHHKTLDVETLAMNLAFILEIFLKFMGENGTSWTYFKFWKSNKGWEKWVNKDSWNMRKDKMRMSWVQKMGIGHYE